MRDVTQDISDLEALDRLAGGLAVCLRPGHRVFLRGGLGVGKTTFVQAMARAWKLENAWEVTSPTFALHHTYEGGPCPIHHLDLYRLENPEAMEQQGVLDPLDDDHAITFVEWSERLDESALRPSLVMQLELVDIEEARRTAHLHFLDASLGECFQQARTLASWEQPS